MVVGIGTAAERLADYGALRARWAGAGISTRWGLAASCLKLSAAQWALAATGRTRGAALRSACAAPRRGRGASRVAVEFSSRCRSVGAPCAAEVIGMMSRGVVCVPVAFGLRMVPALRLRRSLAKMRCLLRLMRRRSLGASWPCGGEADRRTCGPAFVSVIVFSCVHGPPLLASSRRVRKIALILSQVGCLPPSSSALSTYNRWSRAWALSPPEA